MESVEGEKVLVSAKEDEVVEKNVVEVEKDLKVQERVSYWNCDSQTTPGHQCELESDKIEVEQNFSLMPEGCTIH